MSQEATTTSTPKPALQAAGHSGVSQSESGEIFFKPSDLAEVEFYKKVSADHPELQEIVPTFYGILTEGNNIINAENVQPELIVVSETPKESPGAKKKKEHVLALKSSLYGFDEPCILDVKLGHILWDDNAAQEKRDRLDEVARTTTSGSLDMRLTGMNVYYDGKPEGERVDFGKNYGRDLTAESFADGLAKYFVRETTGNKISEETRAYYKYALYYFVNRLKRVAELLQQKSFVMRGASLLFVYEGNAETVQKKLNQLEKAQELERAAEAVEEVAEELEELENELEEEEEEEELTAQDIQDQLFKLDLIDFAHTKFLEEEAGPDADVLRGISILTDVFQDYHDKIHEW
ncbi:uncharacterized protein SAPINGB_P003517 [Magnusiomyces paraingens]|uniref:Kinase n=1 Tax=Magnusiomyces paraingens TaxID=2606893 RepID=A0A5E8BV73_9ASCO|nr:uncharacterized protein SAPINGB_P003517 [Saprochaete ingens]VVT53327.1 unnamed protein product [Saprochaete ingens]